MHNYLGSYPLVAVTLEVSATKVTTLQATVTAVAILQVVASLQAAVTLQIVAARVTPSLQQLQYHDPASANSKAAEISQVAETCRNDATSCNDWTSDLSHNWSYNPTGWHYNPTKL